MLSLSPPPRPLISPARTGSPLNPRPSSQCKPHRPTISTKTHIANLNRILRQQQQQQQSHLDNHNVTPQQLPYSSTSNSDSHTQTSNHPILNALNLSAFLFPPHKDEAMSPRTLSHLHHLLSPSPRPSPRNPIASRWRQFHGSHDWSGLLEPLNPDLRRELIRYGDLVHSAYHAFFPSNPSPSILPSQPRPVPLPDRNYRLTRHLFATSSLTLPSWVPGADHKSSWIGYVAVCDNKQEIARVGRRDIVIALRGTATSHEWAENFRADLVPIDTNHHNSAKVERGFLSLFKTSGASPYKPSLCSAVVDEVKKLIEVYKGEELSITVTGHSLGAALAVLVADELSTCAAHVPPIAVFSFGGPRVGNKGFVDRVERRGVKVLRVVNAHDIITRVPALPPHVFEGYAHVGRELRVDSKASPYLRPDADPACCHDLEAYLHLVDGFMGSDCGFRSGAKRSLVRLLKHQGSNLKQKYVSKARELVVDPVRSYNVQGCLASPS